MRPHVILLLLLLAAVVATTGASDPNVVSTQYGDVKGYTKDGARVWRGIPFAAAPVGKLRFAPPAKPASWSGTLDASRNKDMCPQLSSVDGIVLGSEDCLYLNVYAPEGASPESKLPVLNWIFGGGWVLGDGVEIPELGEDGLYDGKNLATKHNVVIVASNYRLSSLGFLALDSLRSPGSGNTTGNYALQDQRSVLEWVRDNIAGFGGDPDKVTIFGESAGAFSVCWHLASPKSQGLFRAAIVISGTCDSPIFFRAWDRAVSWSLSYADKVGCKDGDSAELVACLRGLSTAQALATGDLMRSLDSTSTGAGTGAGGFVPLLAPVMPWGAAIDGTEDGMTQLPLDAIRSGAFAKVPTIYGTNNNEGSIFIPMLAGIAKVGLPLTQDTASRVLGRFFNASTVAKIWEYYPIGNYKDVDTAAAACLRDYFFVCAERRALEASSRQGVPTWSYRFNYQDDNPLGPILGRSHASGLRFIFDNRFFGGWDDKDKAMAAQYGAYWSGLARGLDPNNELPAGMVTWPKFNASSPLDLVLDSPSSSVQANYDGGVCSSFWNTVTIDFRDTVDRDTVDRNTVDRTVDRDTV